MVLLSVLACSSSSDCAPIDGVDDLLATRTIVVGEMHGTVETPALAGDLACHALAAGKPVLLALEIPASEQERLQFALDRGDRAALLAGPFWTGSPKDGRSSAAVADLILRAHDWKQAGKPIALVGFEVDDDPAPGARPGAHDKAMADALTAAMAAHPDATVVALTGNLHGRRTPGLPWDASYQPMASRLPEPVVAVLGRAVNGSAWNCQGGECKAFEFGDPQATAAPLAIHRLPTVTDGYDAEVELGRFTASPPAVPAAP